MLSHAVVSLLIAFTMLARAALDMMRELRVETDTDPLSGLLNRRGFERAAGEALAQRVKQKLPAALVIADLDHFKAVNDRFGHAVGDRVIVAFAELLRQAAAGNGIAGRLGGEELSCCSPRATCRRRGSLPRRARALSEAAIRDVPERMTATASFGVAAIVGDREPVRIAASRRQRALQRQARRARLRAAFLPAARRSSLASTAMQPDRACWWDESSRPDRR